MKRSDFLKLCGLTVSGSILKGCSGATQTIEKQAKQGLKESERMSQTNQTSLQVIVIGAGVAGLAAARKLQQQGYEVLVLEGRDRIGGRVWSDRTLNGIPLDLGASWIHGITNNPLTEITRNAQIRTMPTNYENIVRYLSQGRVLSDTENQKIDDQFEDLMQQIDSFRDQAEQRDENDISLQAVIDHVTSTMNLNSEQNQALQYSINTTIEHEYANDVRNLSMYYWDDGDVFSGGDVLFPGGYSQVVEAIAPPLTIQRNQIVQQIQYNDQGVRIQTNQGNFVAKAAIVTLPLGVLKRGTVQFSPSLPIRKQDAIQKLGMGVLNKVYFRFSQAFWNQEAEILGYISEQKGEWSEFLNLYKYTQQPVLLAFNAGAYGLAIETLSDQAIIQSGMSVLQKIYGNIPQPIDWLITRWNADPFAGGSYSSIAPGAGPGDRDILAEPIGRSLFFAGEATSREYAATVHGALLSGERAAAQVMQVL